MNLNDVIDYEFSEQELERLSCNFRIDGQGLNDATSIKIKALLKIGNVASAIQLLHLLRTNHNMLEAEATDKYDQGYTDGLDDGRQQVYENMRDRIEEELHEDFNKMRADKHKEYLDETTKLAKKIQIQKALIAKYRGKLDMFVAIEKGKRGNRVVRAQKRSIRNGNEKQSG